MRNYRFLRSRHKIEIDITWQCNLACFDCNRCCGEAKTKERMTVEQIEQFIQESLDLDYRWKEIRVAGGEPTMHPDFLVIMDLLVAYKRQCQPDASTSIVLYTNGFSQRTKELLDKLPPEIVVMNSQKDSGPVRHIGHFNVAPIDAKDDRDKDWTLACTLATSCGIGLTPNGFYHCPIAGTIDRVFGFDIGQRNIPSPDDDMFAEMRSLCSLCGFFDMDDGRILPSLDNTKLLESQPEISESWRQAFARLRAGDTSPLTPY